MCDKIDKFCGTCYWYDLDDDHRVGEFCTKHRCKI